MTTFLEETMILKEVDAMVRDFSSPFNIKSEIRGRINNLLTLQRKQMREMVEKMPTEFPERESDEYDNGYKKALSDILNALGE